MIDILDMIIFFLCFLFPWFLGISILLSFIWYLFWDVFLFGGMNKQERYDYIVYRFSKW